MGPGDLDRALCGLDLPVHPDLIVGLDKADDGGVFRLGPDTALVQTVDFVTPIVDDPHLFGRIAAANSLSDVYAMGARPITALNVAGFPRKEYDIAVLREIFAGGLEAIREAGAVLAGGHTVDDTELKYGLCVTGVVHPHEVITNAAARPGDLLVLTKPLGTGVIATAVKAGAAAAGAEAAMIRSMTRLNRAAAEAARAAGVHACTDITGFGLVGHALEMARASGVAVEIEASRVPLLPGALEYAERNLVPGGTRSNQAFCAEWERFEGNGDAGRILLLHDAQTSGGLLLAVPEDRAERLLEELHRRGEEAAARVGRCLPGPVQARLLP